MGGAIAAGLAKGKLVQSGDIICTARTQATLDKIKAIDPEIVTTDDNAFAAKEADIVILAVKPWLMEEVIADLREHIDPFKQIFVSVAAGITLEELGISFFYPVLYPAQLIIFVYGMIDYSYQYVYYCSDKEISHYRHCK